MSGPTLFGSAIAVPDNETIGSATAADIAARLDRLPATRSIWMMVLMLSLGAFFEFYELFSTAYVLPGIIKSGILTTTTHGFFGISGAASYIAATFIGLLIGVLVFGSIADRMGRRSVFTVALLWYSVSAVVMAMQTDALGLNFWRLMTGIGLGIELVTIDAYLSELVPARLRGRAFAVSMFISYLAVPTVALAAYLLIPVSPFGIDGWRFVILLGGSGALFAWFVRLGLPESPRWLATHGRIPEAERIVEQMEAKARAQSGTLLALPKPQPAAFVASNEKTRFKEIWSGQYRRRTVMLMIFHAAQAIGLYGFSHWMPTFLVEQGVGLSSSLHYGLLISCVAPFGPLLAIAFADRMERKWQIVIAAVVVAIAGAVFVQLRSPAAVLITGTVITLGATIISVGFHTYQAELFPTRIRALAIGFVYSVSRISGAMSGFLIAACLKSAGVPGALTLICGCMLVVALVIALLGPSTSGRALEDISR